MNPIVITLLGQLKSGKNRILITRSGHRYPPKSFKVWRDDMLRQIGSIERPFMGSVFLSVCYTPGDNIRRDVSGMLDALCHVLEQSGAVLDDAQIKYIIWHTMPVEPKRPQCLISLEER